MILLKREIDLEFGVKFFIKRERPMNRTINHPLAKMAIDNTDRY